MNLVMVQPTMMMNDWTMNSYLLCTILICKILVWYDLRLSPGWGIAMATGMANGLENYYKYNLCHLVSPLKCKMNLCICTRTSQWRSSWMVVVNSYSSNYHPIRISVWLDPMSSAALQSVTLNAAFEMCDAWAMVTNRREGVVNQRDYYGNKSKHI